MRMLRSAFLACLLLGACRSSSKPTAEVPTPSATPLSGIRSYEDVDRYAGSVVTIEGRFDHIRGEHGVVILEDDFRIYVPHFDLFRRNDDWFRYVGRRVTATGRLHAYTKDIPGYHGPSLEILSFHGPLD